MSFLKYVLLVALVLPVGWCFAESPTEEAVLEDLSTLASKYGIMVLYLNVDGVAPSMEIRRVGKGLSANKGQVVSFKEIKQGFFMLPLMKGDYQIKTINNPLYNFPYRMNVSDDERWKFTINEQKSNFIGELTIRKEREVDAVFIKLNSSSGKHIRELETLYPQVLKMYPVKHGLFLRDDFLRELKSSEETVK